MVSIRNFTVLNAGHPVIKPLEHRPHRFGIISIHFIAVMDFSDRGDDYGRAAGSDFGETWQFSFRR